MRSLAFSACAVVVLGATGCVVVDGKHRDLLLRDGGGQRDGDVSHTDAGMQFDDQCGADNPRLLLTDTTRDILIDTEAYHNLNNQSCGANTPGKDVFIGVDVVAGEFWHFHLAAVSPDRNPMLFLTQGTSCDSRSCQFVSTACEGTGDEHFAFVADADGRWYIGIDDGVTGGGQYMLSAFRPVCGDGEKTHGEACDDGNLINGDRCDRRCRLELSEARTMEVEPNDNRVESNALRLPASNDLTITGSIGGPGACTYADVFAVSLPDMGDLHVDALNSDDSACASGSLTPFNLSLENSAGEVVLANMEDSSGCAIIRATNQASGEYFVRVSVPAETSLPASYRLHVQVLP